MKYRWCVALGALVCVLLLAACERTPGNATGGTSGSATKGFSTTNVQVTETDFHIDSAFTSFSPGVPYHFIVTNTGKTAHEFMIMPKSQGSMGSMSMGDIDSMALASISNLDPGETKTLDYTFPPSTEGSHPQLACYLPGHYEAGMKQDVIVKS
jgi:uncharacterized cupredoxin-like copper-binding protein